MHVCTWNFAFHHTSDTITCRILAWAWSIRHSLSRSCSAQRGPLQCTSYVGMEIQYLVTCGECALCKAASHKIAAVQNWTNKIPLRWDQVALSSILQSAQLKDIILSVIGIKCFTKTALQNLQRNADLTKPRRYPHGKHCPGHSCVPKMR